jgi:hypothetical protein
LVVILLLRQQWLQRVAHSDSIKSM